MLEFLDVFRLNILISFMLIKRCIPFLYLNQQNNDLVVFEA